MRQLRTLIALAISALAMAGLMASNATAAVEVGQPGEVVLNGVLDIDLDGYPPYVEHYYDCQVEITADFGYDGSISVTNVEADNIYGSSAQCTTPTGYDWLNDCDDAGWTGQIVGPGDQWERGNQTVEYASTGDYEAVLSSCVWWHQSYGGQLDDPIIRFAIDEHTGYETWSLGEQPLYYWEPQADFIRITGSGFSSGQSTNLDIESVE